MAKMMRVMTIMTMMGMMAIMAMMAMVMKMMTMMKTTRCPEGSSTSDLSSYDECIEKALKGRGQKLHVIQLSKSSSSLPL